MKKNVNGFETLEKINFYPGEQIVIGYHDDMDGMLAAVAVKHAIKQLLLLDDTGITFQKMQYHKDRTTGLDGLIGKKLVILVDFCMPRASEFRELRESGLEQIHVYDHHRTAMDFIEMISMDKYHLDIKMSLHDIDPNLAKIKFEAQNRILELPYVDYLESKVLTEKFSTYFFGVQPEEFEVYLQIEEQEFKDLEFTLTILEPEFDYVKYFFDLSRSGCSIAYDEFISYFVSIDKTNVGVSKLNWLQGYAADYDLWKFELENSKNINAGIKIIAQELSLLKNPEVMYNFVFGDPSAIDTTTLSEKFGTEIKIVNLSAKTLKEHCARVGHLSMTFNNMYIDKIRKAAEKKKIPMITVKGIEMFVLNNGHLVSEVGNMLTEFGYPSVQYFVVHEVKDGITKEPELVLSFRSLDTMADVSLVAASLGGGGHRNASGTGIKITDLDKLLKSEF